MVQLAAPAWQPFCQAKDCAWVLVLRPVSSSASGTGAYWRPAWSSKLACRSHSRTGFSGLVTSMANTSRLFPPAEATSTVCQVRMPDPSKSP